MRWGMLLGWVLSFGLMRSCIRKGRQNALMRRVAAAGLGGSCTETEQQCWN